MRVALIGLGVVGQAQRRLLGSRVRVAYDISQDRPYPAAEVACCDMALVTVGTPEGGDGAADLTGLHAAVTRLPAAMPVLVRSTVPPGTITALEKTRPVAGHWPEFLNERPGGQWRESADVPFAVLGGTPAVHETFGPLIRGLGWDPYLCTGLEAELIKYTVNCHLAVKVTFVNEIARICAAFGADWDRVRDGWQQDPRAGESHSRVEGPGFGGRCLPKDLAALTAAARDAGYPAGFLTDVRAANDRYRRSGDSAR